MSTDVVALAQLFSVIAGFVGTLTGIGVGAYVVVRRARRTPTQPRTSDDRFQRLEQAVDAIAIEVERISEGQRFVTKLLAERSAAASPRAPERVITPH